MSRIVILMSVLRVWTIQHMRITHLCSMVCRYRINVERAEWIVYVTDVGQSQHFDMVFKVRKNSPVEILKSMCLDMYL